MTVLFLAYASTVVLLLPMMVCVGVGLWWGRAAKPFSTDFVSRLVTLVAIPALVFHTLMSTALEPGALFDVLWVSIAALLIAAVMSGLMLWALRLPVAALGQTAWIPNAGNLGLPMAQLAFGLEGLAVALTFFAVSSFLSFTLGLRWLTGSAGKALRQPVVWAVLLALLARSLELRPPDWVLRSTELLGKMAVPLMLITLGHALATLPKAGLKLGAWVAGVRFASGAAVAFVVLTQLGLSPLLAGPIALQLLMPCAVNSYLFARLHGTQGDASAGAVLVSTAVFVVLAPLFLWLNVAS
jgi:predicted permease